MGDTGPYWSSQVQPRRFTEGPLRESGTPGEGGGVPQTVPVVTEGGVNSPSSVQEDRRSDGMRERDGERDRGVVSRSEGEFDISPAAGGGGREQNRTTVGNPINHSDDVKLMPAESLGSGSPAPSADMPPPSFIPPHTIRARRGVCVCVCVRARVCVLRYMKPSSLFGPIM